jgi:hypothetical protein
MAWVALHLLDSFSSLGRSLMLQFDKGSLMLQFGEGSLVLLFGGGRRLRLRFSGGNLRIHNDRRGHFR